MVHYFKFLFHQLKGWPLPNYFLFFFGFGAQTMLLATEKLTWLNALTFFGTVVGILCVNAICAAKSINGFLGIIYSLCQVIIAYQARNYLSMIEQVAYVATLDLPVLLDSSWNVDMIHKIRKFKARNWIYALGFTLIMFIITGTLIGRYTGDPRPWIDAMSASVCLTAGIVCFLRYSNQYFWWAFSDASQIVLWYISFRQGSATIAMFVNCCIFFTSDIFGFAISPWFNKKTKARMKAREDREMAKNKRRPSANLDQW